MTEFDVAVLDTQDHDAVVAYERAFYDAFRRATSNRLVRKLWDWNVEEGRLATRIPYRDQRIFTLIGGGSIYAALAANLALREFQSAAFGFSPARRDGAVEVLTFFSKEPREIRGKAQLFRRFVDDARRGGYHTAYATTAEHPVRAYRGIGWDLLAETEIDAERRYFLQFDLLRGAGEAGRPLWAGHRPAVSAPSASRADG